MGLIKRLSVTWRLICLVPQLRNEVLDTVIDDLSKPKAPTEQHKCNSKELEYEKARLALLAKFINVTSKAREIELEWQRIQQEENDAFFHFQSINRGDSELTYLYKKGITDGVKWAITRFS